MLGGVGVAASRIMGRFDRVWPLAAQMIVFGWPLPNGTMLDPAGRLLYRVFVPTTPNPTSGFLVLLPEDQVRFTDIPVEDGVKMIVSGGMLSPERYSKVPAPS